MVRKVVQVSISSDKIFIYGTEEEVKKLIEELRKKGIEVEVVVESPCG